MQRKEDASGHWQECSRLDDDTDIMIAVVDMKDDMMILPPEL